MNIHRQTTLTFFLLTTVLMSKSGLADSDACSANSEKLCASNGASCELISDRNGRDSEVCRWSSSSSDVACASTNGIWTTADSKYSQNHPNAVFSGKAGACITEVGNIQKKKISSRPASSGLAAPSNLTISGVTDTALILSWSDNSDREYGVEVYRVDPVAARVNQADGWMFIGLFEERVDSNVKGTGLRSDEDYDLEPNTNYCYRLRAYVGFDRSEVSDFSGNVCTKTN